MGVFHFLNVKNGDCSIIQHPSGHVSVFDICNGSAIADEKNYELKKIVREAVVETLSVSGNFNQKSLPVNPIRYLKEFGVDKVFRFILTHPDMDHMSGIKVLFDIFKPQNFWDTDNTCEKEFEEGSPYDPEDWEFYKKMRDENPQSDPRRLVLYSGSRGHHYNHDENGKGGGDGLYILSPTKKLVEEGNDAEDYNDSSYVILYRSKGGKILLAGDSHDKTWDHILKNHSDDVKDIDVLIAPHHGRKSDRSYDFLDVLKPKLTLFGNADSEHLAYDAWNSRKLPFITNNQANCVVIDTNAQPMDVYVTNKKFAESYNEFTFYSDEFKAYFIDQVA
ncbi:MAG: hypothetical protein MUD00_01005 [Candidatus Pacebacteria bacterium]|jgi:beta-lactamase superfamily II metal-dependent hydrolase|nr:hypothetical protein [Candidatus Paceibacterota bacterium]